MPELIDRIELRKDFCNMCEAMQPEMIDCEKKGCMSMQIIDEQPTIKAEPVRHGRWIEVTKHRDENGTILNDYECSECCAMVKDSDAEEIESERFCYNCGAKMKQEQPIAYNQAHTGAITAEQFEAIWNDKDDGGADNGNKV